MSESSAGAAAISKTTEESNRSVQELTDISSNLHHSADLLDEHVGSMNNQVSDAKNFSAKVSDAASEQAAGNVKESSDIIGKITNGLQASLEAMETSVRHFVDIRSEVNDLSKSMEEVNNRSQEMSAGTRQLDTAISSSQQQTVQVNESTMRMREQIEQLEKVSNELRRVSQAIRKDSEPLKANAETLQQVSASLEEADDRSRNAMKQLEKQIEKFLID